jgi:transposase InsO family protein
VRHPQTNGFVERMNRTLLDECFRVGGRQTWYVSIEEIQRDVDRFLRYYNLQRSHQGYPETRVDLVTSYRPLLQVR